MIRVLFKALAVGVVIAAVIIYAAYLKTGRFYVPAFSMPHWFAGSPKMEALEAPDEPTWRWRENGQWHYGDKPPVGTAAERIDKHATTLHQH